jgi:hypothetical protein
VKGHLHLLAVQILVYTKLGRARDLAFLEDVYARSPSAEYRAVWEIVKKEGHAAFLQELRTL